MTPAAPARPVAGEPPAARSNGRRRGRSRELDVARHYRRDGFTAYRLPQPSNADVLVLKAGLPPLLVQVKSTAGGPYERFGPRDRAALRHEAIAAGAQCALAWWPPRGKLKLIASEDWPA